MVKQLPHVQEVLTDETGHGKAGDTGQRMGDGEKRPPRQPPGKERDPGSHSAASSLLMCLRGCRGSASLQGTLLPPDPAVQPSARQPQTRTPSWAGTSVLCKGLEAPGGDWTSPQ